MAFLPKIILLATALSLGTDTAAAQSACGYEGFGARQSYTGECAYAGSAIRGDYVGAPLTRFPRPSELVPSAWGYGTYGIPTVSGIRQAPVGTPTIYVIDAPNHTFIGGSRPVPSRILSRGRDGRLNHTRKSQGQRSRGLNVQNGNFLSEKAQMRTAFQSGSRIVTVSMPR